MSIQERTRRRGGYKTNTFRFKEEIRQDLTWISSRAERNIYFFSLARLEGVFIKMF
ncbi:hypothetical protein J6590_089704 [Homalodisca vitripennis]|nr:hypothetical protein J6590_089704 [Homalodisca vitripennis]